MAALTGGRVEVALRPRVHDDISWISKDAGVEPAQVVRKLASICLSIEVNPHYGNKMDRGGKYPDLAEFRRVYCDFDPDHTGEARHRVLYKLEPEDGAPAKAEVWILGPREGMRVYDELMRRYRHPNR